MPRTTGKMLNAWLRGFAACARAPISAAVAAGTLGGLLLVAQAWLLARVIDAVAMRGLGLDDCWPWLLDLLGVFAARAVVSAVADAVAFEAGARVVLEVRARVIDHIAALGPAFTRGTRTGELATTVVDGVENLRRYYDGYLPQTALAAAVPIAILVFVFPQDWISGTIMVLAAPLIPLFMALIGKGAEALNRQQWRQLARMGAQFFDAIEGLTTLKLFDASRREVEVVAATAEDYRLRTMAVLRVAFLSSLMLEFFATVSIAMIAVYVGFRLYFGEMHFLPGFFVLLLAPEFFRPLRTMGVQYHARMEAIGSAEAIVALLATEPRVGAWGDAELPDSAPLAVAFEGVSFGYAADALVIHNVGFRIARGERIALVGPSGAGKTTLGQLLLGFAEPSAGRIAIDGVDLRTLSRAGWMRRVAWLPQRPTLFHGTLRDNLLLARPNATAEELARALASAGADGFVAALPLGLDTAVGDRGQGLSGGEIQRIALARVFLADADVVVLDEASAGLDAETVALVTRSIEALSPGRILLIIAHRLDTVLTVDRVLVIEEGHVVEHGRPEDLLARDSRFAGMVGLFERADA
jgi:ATP-binding cassette subfamily C protein CydD